MCPACYDAEAQVLWNALAPELWRRTTIALHRTLAHEAGVGEAGLRRLVRISWAKVAEFQRRGAIHFLDKLPVHVAELVRAAWKLGGHSELDRLRLRWLALSAAARAREQRRLAWEDLCITAA